LKIENPKFGTPKKLEGIVYFSRLPTKNAFFPIGKKVRRKCLLV